MSAKDKLLWSYLVCIGLGIAAIYFGGNLPDYLFLTIVGGLLGLGFTGFFVHTFWEMLSAGEILGKLIRGNKIYLIVWLCCSAGVLIWILGRGL